MQTRKIRRLLSAALLSLSLTACGGSNATPPPGDPGPVAPGPAEPEPGDPVIENHAPVISISAPDGEVLELSPVTLSAGNSSDPDGDALAFTWRQIEGPAATIVDHDAAGGELNVLMPKVVDRESVVFELIVSDGEHEVAATQAIAVREGHGILFTASGQDGTMELYRKHETDAAAVRLGDGLAPASGTDRVKGFAISPDRRHVAYLKDADGDGAFRLMVAGVNGLGERDITGTATHTGATAEVTGFSWSPVAAKLLFRGDLGAVDDRFELYSVSVMPDGTTTGRRAVSGPMGIARQVLETFEWSPDGTRAAFIASDADAPNVFRLFAVSMEGEETAVSLPAAISASLSGAYDVTDLAWSPDASRIAYRVDGNMPNLYDTVPGLYVTHVPRAVTGHVANENAVVSVPPVPDHLVVGFSWFGWSPDGSYLAYVGHLDDADSQELGLRAIQVDSVFPGVAVTVSGDSITEFGNVHGADWAPNSRGLAFHGDLDEPGKIDLYSVQIAESGQPFNRRKLTSAASPDVHGDYEWVIDSRHVVYRRNGMDSNSPERLARADIITGDLANFDGGAANRFIGEGTKFFSVSPDGSQVAFLIDGEHNGKMELFEVAADAANGSERVRISPDVNDNAALDIENFKYSPDGSRVAVKGDLLVEDDVELFIVEPGQAAYEPVSSGVVEIHEYTWFGPETAQ